MKRRALREQIFKLLFRVEFLPPEDIPMQAEMFFESGDQTIGEDDRTYILEKTQAVIREIPEIDRELDDCMEGWTMKRIGRVEKTILRLAVYESPSRKQWNLRKNSDRTALLRSSTAFSPSM